MTRFTVFDTAAAARKVSKLFEDTIQTDCSMHTINLYLVYAMGMRDHVETVVKVDEETGEMKKVRQVCTEGGAFPEGARLTEKVRAVNNYFNTAQRVERLARIQRQNGLPELVCKADCGTRVGSTVSLFTRSIVSYAALKCYFENGKAGDDPAVFLKLSGEARRLITEMEAICSSMAHLACTEVQRDEVLASELPMMIKIAVDRLIDSSFSVCTLDAPRTVKMNDAKFPRHRIPFLALSVDARTCVARLKAQVLKRMAMPTEETATILLLDPRTKFSVEDIIQTKPSERQEIRHVIEAGHALLREAHREVFASIQARSDVSGQRPSMAINLDLVPSMVDGTVLRGAELPTATAGSLSVSTLDKQADEALKRWLSFRGSWVMVAMHQTTDKTKTEDDFTKLLLVQQGGVVSDNRQTVLQHVDVCQWFHETGKDQFPSVANLACVWLGRSLSNACQERDFSTGGITMGPLRSRTDNERAEKQLLLKHNKAEIRRMRC